MRTTLLMLALTSVSLVLAAPSSAIQSAPGNDPNVVVGTCPDCALCDDPNGIDDGYVAFVMSCLKGSE